MLSASQADAFARLPARHKELSIIASLDDEPARPSPRLVELMARALARLPEARLPVFEGRHSQEPRWFDTWPGEHYRLLPLLVELLGATTVVEIGTFTGMGTLALRQALPANGRLVTFDLIGWDRFAHTWLQPADFGDGRLAQVLADVSTPEGMQAHRAVFEAADFIFVDGPKDGVTEARLLAQLAALQLPRQPVLLFDDIRVMNMVGIWRSIRQPKFDITSLAHWSGSGLVDWQG